MVGQLSKVKQFAAKPGEMVLLATCREPGIGFLPAPHEPIRASTTCVTTRGAGLRVRGLWLVRADCEAPMWIGFDWPDIGKLATWALTMIGSSFIGSYFGSYLKKKGENLATHEDTDKIVEQVKAVTQTTKEIEAKISGELWNRQKQWEMKREVTFGAAKAASGVKDALTRMHAICMTDKRSAQQGGLPRTDKQTEAYMALNKAADELDEAFMLVSIACGDDLRNKIGRFALFARGLAAQIADGNPEKFLDLADELASRWTDVARAIRAEMDLKT